MTVTLRTYSLRQTIWVHNLMCGYHRSSWYLVSMFTQAFPTL